MENEDVNVVDESQSTEVATETATEQPNPGSKTEPELLLKSLQEERDKRRLLEQELQTIRQTQVASEDFSDEGRALKSEIESIKESLALEKLTEQHPALNDKLSEFNEFRQQYPGLSVEKVVKVFLAEKDLLTAPKERKGLEKPAGGARTAPAPGPSADDIAVLRQTNYRKYLEMVKQGKINLG